MADKTKPVWPAEADDVPKAYLELPPDAIPDISATSELNLIGGMERCGALRQGQRQRRNYRVIAAVQQPNFHDDRGEQGIRDHRFVASQEPDQADMDRDRQPRCGDRQASRLLRASARTR